MIQDPYTFLPFGKRSMQQRLKHFASLGSPGGLPEDAAARGEGLGLGQAVQAGAARAVDEARHPGQHRAGAPAVGAASGPPLCQI